MEVIRKIINIIVYLYFIVSVMVVVGFLFFGDIMSIWVANYIVIEEDYEKADAIILLGGEEGSKRLNKAVSLFYDGYGDVIINSGNGNDERAIKNFGDKGILEAQFINEPKSTTTFENALFTKEIVREHGYESVIIVSTPQQSRRARWIFERIYKDMDVDIYSAVVDDSNYKPEELKSSKFSREMLAMQFVKLVWYWREYWSY